MKKKNLLMTMLASFGLAMASFAQIPSYVPTDGLGVYYPFNNNANELVNNLNGVVNGVQLADSKDGIQNNAYSFNGTSDNIDIPFDFFNSNNSQSENTFWVRFKYNSISTEELGIWNKDGSWRELRIRIHPDKSISFSGAYPNYYFGIQSLPNSILENEWYDVVFDISNNEGKMYINGILAQTQSNDISSSSLSYSSEGSCGTSIGINRFGFVKLSCVATRYFNGIIDEFGIWNRSLSSQEILNLYNGCSNPPTATITAAGNTMFCIGNNVSLEANIGPNFTYQWYRNGTLIPNATNQTFLAEQAGFYTVSIYNGECSAVSNAIQVIVNSLPNVTFNSIGNLVSKNANAINLSGTPNGGTFNGVGVSGNQFIPFNAGLGAKTLTYTYTDNNGCTNSATQQVIVYDTVACSVSDTLIMDVLLSVNPLTYNVIKVYPNPSNTQLFIHTGNFSTMSNYTIRIDNSLGQQVYTTPINQQEYIIDVSTWSGYGTYFLHLVDGNGNSVEIKKIILQ